MSMLPTLSTSSHMHWFSITLTQSSISSLYPYISLSLGLGAWVGRRGRSELGRRIGSVATLVRWGDGIRGLKVERKS